MNHFNLIITFDSVLISDKVFIMLPEFQKGVKFQSTWFQLNQRLFPKYRTICNRLNIPIYE